MSKRETRGSIVHERGRCELCQRGDRNTLFHPHQRLRLYLKPFGRVWVSRDDEGNSFKNAGEAYFYLVSIQKQLIKGTFIPYHLRNKSISPRLFGNFFQKHMTQYRTTQKYFQSIWNHDLAGLTQSDVEDFYQGLPESLKVSSKNLIMRILRATLGAAAHKQAIGAIPLFPRLEKAEKPAKTFLTRDQQEVVISSLPQEYRPLFSFLALHGKRIGEVLSLRWENIDHKHKTALLYESKVKQEREMALDPDWLKSLKPVKLNGYVFYQWSRTWLQMVLTAACEKAGVPPVTMHEFGRHSFICQGVAAGLTAEQIATITNNLRSLPYYLHNSIEVQRNVLEKMKCVHQVTKVDKISQ